MADGLRLADLLAALSVVTDLGMGQEPEKAVRACLVATELARASGLPEAHVRDVYYTTLMHHVGCTAPAHETTHVFGDDLGPLPRAERTDPRSIAESVALLSEVGKGTGLHRARHLARMVGGGKAASETIYRSVCEVGAQIAERLGLGAQVQHGLLHTLEAWDGKDSPYHLQGDDIALPARYSALAMQVVIFDRLGGPEAAREMVRRRRGGWFDPAIADTFDRVGAVVLDRLATADVWHEVLLAEPEPVRQVGPGQLDRTAHAFADMVDLKTPFTLGHSAGVAELAAGAGQQLGLADASVTMLRRAGWLHDLGRVAVPDATWEQPRALSASQWEQVRLHPYHTERILDRSVLLRPLARVAGMHHERHDGSGYHRGAKGGEIPAEAQILGVADAFQAMTQERPHRSAFTPEQAAHQIEVATREGRFDPECARAVVEAAGEDASRVRRDWPNGLSDREVEVIRLVARGLSNKQVADELVISRRTAEHHVQHIYTKIGVSTRASAAMFAMQHGLLP